MSCVDEAVCGRFGPPTFAQHLGQVIEQIDRVQKRVRDMQEEETLQLIRECEQAFRIQHDGTRVVTRIDLKRF